MSVDPIGLDLRTTRAALDGTRWFPAGAGEIEAAAIVDIPLHEDAFALVIVNVIAPDGSESLYQLALALDGDRPRDALDRPDLVGRLCGLCGVDSAGATVRPMGVEQSNSSVVLDEQHVLKLYRRLERGPHPELELLGALQSAAFTSMPRFEGSLTADGIGLAAVTRFVPSLGDGWNVTLERLRDDPPWLPNRAARLGDATARMHAALASAFPEPDPESADDLQRLAVSVADGLRELTSVPGAEDGARLAIELAGATAPGRLIRVHGDYHLGQVLWSETDGWVVIDFEGEPDRSLEERRQPRSPFVDLAGMTRSFDYIVDGAPRLVEVDLPRGWLDTCVDAFLAAYLAAVPPELLPASRGDVERRLALHELERLMSELRYELAHRPEWAAIPAAGLRRLLDRRIGG